MMNPMTRAQGGTNKKQLGEKEQGEARYHGRDFKENLFVLLQ